MKHDEEIDFIARHYRRGAFASGRALERIMPGRMSRLRTVRIAAAAALLIAAGTAAALLITHSSSTDRAAETVPQDAPTAVADDIKVIDFESTPLTVVAEKIREVYGVSVRNLPDDAGDITLSLHYEGSAADLVDTINEILSTQMTIEE